MQSESIAIHSSPVWRSEANYVLRADLAPHGLAERFEQIWVKKLVGRKFKICCIPFFTYGFALGDTVSANDEDMIVGMARKGRHRNLRIAVSGKDVDRIHFTLHHWVEDAGNLYEWHDKNYLAVDLPSRRGQPSLNLITRMAKANEIFFEID
jgi:hypothetical protein